MLTTCHLCNIQTCSMHAMSIRFNFMTLAVHKFKNINQVSDSGEMYASFYPARAKAVTGRQCPHKWSVEVFLPHQTGPPHENDPNLETLGLSNLSKLPKLSNCQNRLICLRCVRFLRFLRYVRCFRCVRCVRCLRCLRCLRYLG